MNYSTVNVTSNSAGHSLISRMPDTVKLSSADISLKLFSKTEAAKRLGIGKEILGKLINEGKIGYIMIKSRIRIPYTEIIKFLEENIFRKEKSIEPKDDVDRFMQHSSKRTKKEIITNEFFNQLKEEFSGQRVC